MADRIDHPAHYNRGRIEVIDFVEDQDLGFNLGNAIKYIARAGFHPDEDRLRTLEKAKWYVQREIQLIKFPGLTSKQAQAEERKDNGNSFNQHLELLKEAYFSMVHTGNHPTGADALVPEVCVRCKLAVALQGHLSASRPV